MLVSLPKVELWHSILCWIFPPCVSRRTHFRNSASSCLVGDPNTGTIPVVAEVLTNKCIKQGFKEGGVDDTLHTPDLEFVQPKHRQFWCMKDIYSSTGLEAMTGNYGLFLIRKVSLKFFIFRSCNVNEIFLFLWINCFSCGESKGPNNLFSYVIWYYSWMNPLM